MLFSPQILIRRPPRIVSGTTPFNIDGTPQSISSGSPGDPFSFGAFSTTYGNNINVVVVVTNGNPVVGITDTAGNTYSKITSASTLEIWYAKCAAVQSGNVVTVDLTSSAFTTASLSSFSGCNFTSPFDPNIPSGVDNSSATTTPITITTTNADDIIIGVSIPGTGTASAASPWTAIYNSTSGQFLAVEYKIVSVTQSSISLNFTDNTTFSEVGIALVKAP